MKNNYNKIYIGLFFSLLGFVYILIVTSVNNLGASPDSVSYLEASQNIFNGTGLTYYGYNPVVAQWPPLYPITISFIGKTLGMDSINAAKYLSALLLFFSVFVLNLIFIKFRAGNLTLIILNLLFLTSSALSVFLMIWSEPLFIFLLILLCYFFLNWIDSNNNFTLFVTAVLSGLLMLTRFAGIGFVLGIIVFLIFKKDTLKVKLKNLILYSVVSLSFAISWVIYLSKLSPGSTKRDIVFHLISAGHLKQLLGTLINWTSPSFTRIGFVLLFIVFIFFLFDIRKRKVKFQLKNIDIKTKFLVLVLITYLGFLLFTVSFIDFHIYFENRILAPAFPILLMLSIPLLEKIQALSYQRYFYFAAILFILISCSFTFINRSSKFYINGEGYTTKVWQESETVRNLKKYPAASIYTNGRDALRLLYSENKNQVYSLPSLYFPSSQKQNPEYQNQMNGLKDSIESQKSILVFFDNCAWRTYYPGEEQIKSELGNFNFDEQNDGFILHK